MAAYDDDEGNNNDAADYYAYADATAGDDIVEDNAAGDENGTNHYVNTDNVMCYSHKARDNNF